MSTHSEYDKRPSWVKENLSQLLLLLAMLMVVVSLAVYFFYTPLSELIFAEDRAAAQKIIVNKAPVKVITENWQEDQQGPIENTQYNVGDSDLNDKRVVISKEELVGLEQRYRIDLVETAEKPLPAGIEGQQSVQTIVGKNGQPSISIIRMSDSFASDIDRVNGQAELFLSGEKKHQLLLKTAQLNGINLILTPAETLMAKSPSLFTLRLSAMESWEKLQDFVIQHDLLKENIYVYRTIRNHKPWYVLLLGEYRSFPGAKIAQQGLPGALANFPSQVFTYKEIQQDLQLKND
ncbi:MAG: DamX protein [Psychromonas sp.]|jgi:DamX protein|uniref:SPOR domain-containing protein n=1 Tax=Psychromonas sp. TaxID=1884585 RepID=UPI0039E3A725